MRPVVLKGITLRDRLWRTKVPPIERRHKLWRLRGRIHHRHGYYSPYERVGLPWGHKPRRRRPIYTAAHRAELRDD